MIIDIKRYIFIIFDRFVCFIWNFRFKLLFVFIITGFYTRMW